MNQAIHCSCGLVFGNRAQATQHIEYVRDVLHASDAHTVIDETTADAPLAGDAGNVGGPGNGGSVAVETPSSPAPPGRGGPRPLDRRCPPGFLCIHEPRCVGAANPVLSTADNVDRLTPAVTARRIADAPADAASFTASPRVIRLDALAREAVDAKLEMMRGKLAIETTIVAGEVARSRYEAARVKLEQIDKAMDIELAGMIAELGEAKAP